MGVLELIDTVQQQVPAGAPFGSRSRATGVVQTAMARHTVVVAARIDAQGQRREQFWCDGLRLERPVLLRLTCAETECPHAVQVRRLWQAHIGASAAPMPRAAPSPRPLLAEQTLRVGSQTVVARPARFPCFTPCPHQAHPPLLIDKSGWDLFEQGIAIGGGLAHGGGPPRPRFPSLAAARAHLLARQMEAQAALAMASRRPGSAE